MHIFAPFFLNRENFSVKYFGKVIAFCAGKWYNLIAFEK